MHIEIGLLDEGVGPGASYQVAPAYQLARMLNQRSQDL
jgi:hypothetical protein